MSIHSFSEYAQKQDQYCQVYLELADHGATHEEIVEFFKDNGMNLDEGLYDMLKGMASGGVNLGRNLIGGTLRALGGGARLAAGAGGSLYGMANKAITGDDSALRWAGRQGLSGLQDIGTGVTQAITSPVAAVIRAGKVGREKGWLPKEPKKGGNWWQRLMGLRKGGAAPAAPTPDKAEGDKAKMKLVQDEIMRRRGQVPMSAGDKTKMM